MKYIYTELALEVTRRCNIICKNYCMRGPSQNINLNKDFVDSILNKNKIKKIFNICFSGGEPTLNPNIIVYTIDKIIREEIDVEKIGMVTNGQIFNKDIVDAFNRFNDYCLERKRKEIKEQNLNTDGFIYKPVWITFSIDKYHQEINPVIKDLYFKEMNNCDFYDKDTNYNKIIKSGFSTIGKEFLYSLSPLYYLKENNYNVIYSHLYLTANGNLTTEGMGSYVDMDRINMGNIKETSFEEMLDKYGFSVNNAMLAEQSGIGLKKGK